jgi:Domain of unknown function (DUF4124)
MRVGWAVLLGLAGGIALAWWLSREPAEVKRDRQARAEQAAAANARDARPVLYRWRDASGVLQISDQPPKGRRYERVDMQPRDGIEVDGSRP